jgi:hypothetical protein
MRVSLADVKPRFWRRTAEKFIEVLEQGFANPTHAEPGAAQLKVGVKVGSCAEDNAPRPSIVARCCGKFVSKKRRIRGRNLSLFRKISLYNGVQRTVNLTFTWRPPSLTSHAPQMSKMPAGHGDVVRRRSGPSVDRVPEVVTMRVRSQSAGLKRSATEGNIG